MIHLTSALLCEAATDREGLLHLLGGGITLLAYPNFPAPLNAELAMSFIATDVDPNEKHVINVLGTESLKGRKLFDATIEAKITQPQISKAPQSIPVILPLRNAGIPEPGNYQIEISLDDKFIAQIPFRAILSEKHVQPQPFG